MVKSQEIQRATKVIDIFILTISVTVMLLALVLMVSVLIDPGPRSLYAVFGLFGFVLTMSYAVVDRKQAVALAYGSIRAKVAKESKYPDFQMFLFPARAGEISRLLPPESLPTPVSKPASSITLPPNSVLGPGFIYIMRRADGIYKIGRSTDPSARLAEHIRDYKQNFTLIKFFAVSDMAAFERLALRMTRIYAYKKEGRRQELRKMTDYQLNQFMIDFEKMTRG